MAETAAAGVSVIGVKELTAKLAALPSKVAKKLQRSSLRVAGKILLNAVKANTPVDTGALRGSFKLRAGRRSRRNRGVVRVVVSTNAENNLFKGDTFHGGFIEFGTKFIAPRGFIKQAATQSKEPVAAAFRSDLAGKIAALARNPSST